MKPIRFWLISHSPDLTETGMFTQRTYVKTVWQGFVTQISSEEDILSDWCFFKRFGVRTAYVQGVAPTAAWSIREISEEEFNKAEPIKWGGLPTATKRVVLGIGNKGGAVDILLDEEAKPLKIPSVVRDSEYRFIDSRGIPDDVLESFEEVCPSNNCGKIINPRSYPKFKQWLKDMGENPDECLIVWWSW